MTRVLPILPALVMALDFVIPPTSARDMAGQVAPEAYANLVKHFDYDARAPLDVRELASEPRLGATIHDISYASPKGGRVPAFLVVPQGGGDLRR